MKTLLLRALFFKLLIESVYEHLLGLLLDHLWRKTENYWKFPLGMFGRPPAVMHAIEPQGHKTLHGHECCLHWWNVSLNITVQC